MTIEAKNEILQKAKVWFKESIAQKSYQKHAQTLFYRCF